MSILDGQASSTEIAWAAGLFEGEGCMHFRGTPGKRGGNAVLSLAMTDADVVEKFRAIIGAGNLYLNKHPRKKNWKPVRRVHLCTAADIVTVLEALKPYFGERRTAKAEETIRFAEQIEVHKGEKTHCPEGHPYEGENLIEEPITRESVKGEIRSYTARRCRTCRRAQDRKRMRAARAARETVRS